MASNGEVARLLHELAVLTEVEEGSRQSFRARAYHNAVRAIENSPRDVTSMSVDELVAIKGVGKAIALKIREFADTGRIAKVEQLRERYPPGYVGLLRVPGLGPKTIAILREQLGITTVDQLREAIAQERLRDVAGLGKKTEENLVKAIERLGMSGKERRTPILEALPLALELVEVLAEIPGVERADYAGSLRRFRESVADLDIVVAASDPGPVMEYFTTSAAVDEVLSSGDKKASIRTRRGLQIDLRVVGLEQYGAALVYFTGSKQHNVRIRERAVKRGLTLNEYGLFRVETGDLLAGANEEEVYAALDMAWVDPVLREDNGEIEAAIAGTLPQPMQVEDIVGDLHVHSDWSGDGRATLEAMATTAARRGLRYIAITDHAENLRINGLSRERMLEQRVAIAQLQERMPDLQLIHGAELNIGADGSLDYDEDFLLGFDWGLASVHSHFTLPQAQQTERIITAMQHPAVHAIGHLQGRRVGKRAGIELDLDAMYDAAVATGTAIEINSNLDRLDASAEVLLAARGRGVTFVINTDSHNTREFAYVSYGVLQARRGWVTADQVANTWPFARFRAWTGAKRERVG